MNVSWVTLKCLAVIGFVDWITFIIFWFKMRTSGTFVIWEAWSLSKGKFVLLIDIDKRFGLDSPPWERLLVWILHYHIVQFIDLDCRTCLDSSIECWIYLPLLVFWFNWYDNVDQLNDKHCWRIIASFCMKLDTIGGVLASILFWIEMRSGYLALFLH